MILALDPSSTCLGFAVAESGTSDPVRMIEFGRITPDKPRTTVYGRTISIIRQLADCDFERPDYTVIEIPALRPPRHARGQARTGQALYGMAVGLIVAHVEAHPLRYGAMVLVAADEWTHTAKAKRAAAIAALYPEYRAAADPGMDIADAIGLAAWYVESQR